MRHRALAVSVVLATVLAACNTVGDAVDDLQTLVPEAISPSEGGGTSAPSEGGATPTGGAGDGGATEGDGGGDEGGDGDGGDGGQTAQTTPADDFGGVGANGRAYLRGDRPLLIVEIDVQEGAQVDQSAIDHLLATIRQYADKPEGVVQAGGNTFSSDRTEWDRSDLRAAAKANRSNFTDGGTAVVYALVVRGGYHSDGEQTNAIGVTYNGSEMAIFPDRWSGLTGILGSSQSIARAVFVHEFGHLLGLVNITYDSELDHEDPDHAAHSSNKSSVMYYAIETTLIGQVFNGPPPDQFDDADRADIEGLRSGRY